MSHTPNENPTSWLDEALRDVPLPPDLIARLRRLGVDSNAELDAAVQRVAVPEGLIARLKSIPDDVALDRRLRRIAVPAGLTERLKEIAGDGAGAAPARPPRGSGRQGEPQEAPATSVTNDRPSRMASPLAAGARDHRASRMRSAPAWIVAASLLAVVALGVLGYFGGPRLVAHRPNQGERSRTAISHVDILEDAAEPSEVPGGFQPGSGLHSLADSGHGLPRSPDVLAGRLRTRPSQVLEQYASVVGAGSMTDPLRDVGMYALEQLAMPESGPPAVPLGMLRQDELRGLAPPAVEGFDLSGLLRDGVNPFVSPADDPRLEMVQVPLTRSTASFEDFRLLSAEGEVVSPQEVRTEEFLAAVDYDFPLPQEEALALFASGGPSPWDPFDKKLLLLGVQARGHGSEVRPPTELTIVLDLSLRWPGVDALAACREALGRVVESLQERDRISVILAAQRPVPLAQGVGPEAAAELLRAVERIATMGPQPLVDIVPAIESAVRQASQGGSERRLVVCLTSDLAHIGGSEQADLVQLVAGAAGRGVQFDVVRLASGGPPDEACMALAQAGGGEVHAAADATGLWASLYRLVTMQSAVAARDVSLTVQFDPRAVKGYRLLGHDARPLEPGGDGPWRVDLLLEDTAVVMFELELRNTGSADVATAHLRWQDPRTGALNERVQRVGAAQFATTLGEAALPLQRGTIAAAAAEILRRVPYARPDADLGLVLDLADTVDSRLWDEAWFIEFLNSTTRAQALEAGIRNSRH